MRLLGLRSVFWLPVLLGLWFVPAEASHLKHRPWGSNHHHAPKRTLVAHRARAVLEPQPSFITTSATETARRPLYNDLDVRKPDAGSEIAQQALVYTGSNYRFGGTSAKGMDCSGLVSRIYADLKLHRVPRVSAALYKSGRPVEMSALRPGDLVFFKNTYKHGISHVGVYAGNNKFVHAANKRYGVIVTSMADPYYQIHFAGARRLY